MQDWTHKTTARHTVPVRVPARYIQKSLKFAILHWYVSKRKKKKSYPLGWQRLSSSLRLNPSAPTLREKGRRRSISIGDDKEECWLPIFFVSLLRFLCSSGNFYLFLVVVLWWSLWSRCICETKNEVQKLWLSAAVRRDLWIADVKRSCQAGSFSKNFTRTVRLTGTSTRTVILILLSRWWWCSSLRALPFIRAFSVRYNYSDWIKT